jgi:hypothetical protein
MDSETNKLHHRKTTAPDFSGETRVKEYQQVPLPSSPKKQISSLPALEKGLFLPRLSTTLV